MAIGPNHPHRLQLCDNNWIVRWSLNHIAINKIKKQENHISIRIHYVSYCSLFISKFKYFNKNTLKKENFNTNKRNKVGDSLLSTDLYILWNISYWVIHIWKLNLNMNRATPIKKNWNNWLPSHL